MYATRLKYLTAVSAICGSLCLPQSKAANITLNWATPVAVANTSAKALNCKAFTNMTGNKDPELQFQVLAAGLPPGTYTATFDFRFANKPDQQRTAMRGSNGDGNHYDREVPSGGAIALDTWYRATGTVVITGSDNWTGTYELKPVIFGNPPSDAADEFDILYDNVNLTDSSNQSELIFGMYNFESDSVGSAPANVPVLKANQFSEFGVVSILAPANLFAASIALNTGLSQATITWTSGAGEVFDVFRSGNLEFSEPAIATGIIGEAGFTSYMDTSLPSGGKAFYRVFRR